MPKLLVFHIVFPFSDPTYTHKFIHFLFHIIYLVKLQVRIVRSLFLLYCLFLQVVNDFSRSGEWIVLCIVVLLPIELEN
jgi:hypothetical protein